MTFIINFPHWTGEDKKGQIGRGQDKRRDDRSGQEKTENTGKGKQEDRKEEEMIKFGIFHHVWSDEDSSLDREQLSGPSGLGSSRGFGLFYHQQILHDGASSSAPFHLQTHPRLRSENEDLRRGISNKIYEGHHETKDEGEDHEDEDQESSDQEDGDDHYDGDDEDEDSNDEDEDSDGQSEDEETDSLSVRSLSPWRMLPSVPREGVESIAPQLQSMRRRPRRDEVVEEEEDAETDRDVEEPPRRRIRTESNEERRFGEPV
ncbi:nucleolin-like [Hoplias malabaricus]|uniref:nucleolin-like n=1 Tax=Hoplias malabaricus TaxID=27720 RepID=UPI003461B365